MNQNDLSVERMNLKQIEAALVTQVDPKTRIALTDIMESDDTGFVARELGNVLRTLFELTQHPENKELQEQAKKKLDYALDSAPLFYHGTVFNLRKAFMDMYNLSGTPGLKQPSGQETAHEKPVYSPPKTPLFSLER